MTALQQFEDFMNEVEDEDPFSAFLLVFGTVSVFSAVLVGILVLAPVEVIWMLLLIPVTLFFLAARRVVRTVSKVRNK